MKNQSIEYAGEIAGPPREKAQALGIGSLSDAELVALLIGWGAKGSGVLDVAMQACVVLDSGGGQAPGNTEALTKIRGLGRVKSMQIAAALELGRRRYKPGLRRIQSPEDAWNCVRHYGDRLQEHFFVLCLNGAHELTCYEMISKGLLNRSLVHPREVFAPAISGRNAAIVVAHNHPSGNLTPSSEDMEVTRRLQEAGDILGISLLDHIIFSATEYISLREQGEI
ncbi:RadC family protein [Salinispira pacifica]|uniref:DNA repair protein RadC n=1 Tax=Salinispira pacifica TaxID=1307761 RepID=V5WF60_9SPIO|nr:DNA repair protein RadC [Salinispira pacifica]AHC14179.1 DNA repair protein RadC [Salinispira pacifica]